MMIVITGVSQGLGLAMTQQFIKLGHTVLGCTRSSTSVDKLRQKFGTPHNFTTVDVSDEQQVQTWTNHLLTNYAAPNLIINNAAVINQPAPLWKVPSQEFSYLIDVNIKGVANVIRHFVPAMITKRSGIIVNFSSGWGRSTSADVAPYCASKWAIEGLTQSLAQELPNGMAAIALNPGIIHTQMLETCFGESAAAYTPIQSWVKKAVPFLLQLKSSDNGTSLTVPT